MMKLNLDPDNLFDELPGLLYSLRSRPQDERVLRLEQQLREGVESFNQLLCELYESLQALKVTAGEIRELGTEDTTPGS